MMAQNFGTVSAIYYNQIAAHKAAGQGKTEWPVKCGTPHIKAVRYSDCGARESNGAKIFDN